MSSNKPADKAKAARMKSVVRNHYGLRREVSDQELDAELASLRRKAKEGSLDDMAEQLAAALGVI